MALGIYRIIGFNPLSFMIPAIAMALSSGVFEELLFRGVLFRSVETWFRQLGGPGGLSLVFGLTHLMNKEGTLEGALFIAVEAGVLLAGAFMLTRRLWMSIGFHVAWNYTQSAIFSSIVSGNEASQGLIRSTVKGPNLLTGGSFGVESSVPALLLCTTTGIVLVVRAVKQGKIVPRSGNGPRDGPGEDVCEWWSSARWCIEARTVRIPSQRVAGCDAFRTSCVCVTQRASDESRGCHLGEFITAPISPSATGGVRPRSV